MRLPRREIEGRCKGGGRRLGVSLSASRVSKKAVLGVRGQIRAATQLLLVTRALPSLLLEAKLTIFGTSAAVFN